MMEKASRAITSARLLLDAGDVDGACNRAYYAMHDAAKAALDVSCVSLDSDTEEIDVPAHAQHARRQRSRSGARAENARQFRHFFRED